jgi:hypothetical protein
VTTPEKNEEYKRLAHAIQSAIAYQMNLNSTFTSPKHLRVGIDILKGEQASFARLLISKGIITEEEYFDSILDGLRAELEFQTNQARERSGFDNLSFG